MARSNGSSVEPRRRDRAETGRDQGIPLPRLWTETGLHMRTAAVRVSPPRTQ